MNGQSVYLKTKRSMINYLEILPQELHIFWNDGPEEKVDDSSSMTKKQFKSEIINKSTFHAMWLRDNDPGPMSRHSSNGQRLFNIVDIPEDLYIKRALVDIMKQDNGVAKETVMVEFGGKLGCYSFESIFDVDFLKRHDYCNHVTAGGNTRKDQAFVIGQHSTPSGSTNPQAKTMKNDERFDSSVKLWDKQFFQDIFKRNEVQDSSKNLPFKNGLKFHNYDTLHSLNMEWKQDYCLMNGKISNKSSRNRLQSERKNKFKPLFNFLKDFVEYGFMLLEGIPVEEGEILNIPALFDGYVRETNYGPLFDVQAKKNPNNLAFTNLAVTPHTDNPYRNPVPSIQILHCLKNECEGGLSGLVDGFLAAEKIWNISSKGLGDFTSPDDQDTNYFRLLSTYFIPYEYHNPPYVVSEENDIKMYG